MPDKTENCWPENWPLTAVEEIENREDIIEAQAAEIERLREERNAAVRGLADEAGKRGRLEVEYERLVSACSTYKRNVERLEAEKREAVEALKEALEWNWMDEDAPRDVELYILGLIARL